MDYISGKARGALSKDPYEIDYNTLKMMLVQNEQDKAECRMVTESSYRGESYFENNKCPDDNKPVSPRTALYREVLYRDRKTDGFSISYPYGNILQQGERNHYYRGENKVYTRSVKACSVV